MATFVLVHGAFQGGWVWKDVASHLRPLGNDVHTPTLSGCGYLTGGLREGLGLEEYVQEVVEYLRCESLSDVILVAHSYSGMVCGAVAMRVPELLRKTVFVDAVIPESNRSFAEMSGEMFQNMLAKQRADNGLIRPWPLPVFGVPEDKGEWFGARMRAFPEAAFTTPLPGEFDPTQMSGALITCTRTKNPFINKMADKARGLGWPVTALDSDHSPMSSNAQELAGLLHQVGAASPA
ncbi:MAG: alpha/beta fold hydrolase [Desulfovibrionaceae bacterium]